MQWPKKDKEVCSGGNKKCGKTVKFDNNMQDVNTMVSHDSPTPREKKGGYQKKKPKSDQDNAAISEDERTYVIDCINLGEHVHDSESDSE